MQGDWCLRTTKHYNLMNIETIDYLLITKLILLHAYIADSPSSLERPVRSMIPSEVSHTQVSPLPCGGKHCVPVGSAKASLWSRIICWPRNIHTSMQKMRRKAKSLAMSEEGWTSNLIVYCSSVWCASHDVLQYYSQLADKGCGHRLFATHARTSFALSRPAYNMHAHV